MRWAGLVPRKHFALPFQVVAILSLVFAGTGGKGALTLVGKGSGSREAVGILGRRRPARQEAEAEERHFGELGWKDLKSALRFGLSPLLSSCCLSSCAVCVCVCCVWIKRGGKVTAKVGRRSLLYRLGDACMMPPSFCL